MPVLKLCTFPGCSARVSPPYKAKQGPRCDAHTNLAGPTSGSYYWKKLRKVVLARDGHRCRQCGATNDLTAHLHEDMQGDHTRATLEDCITLCRPCHGRLDQLRSG